MCIVPSKCDILIPWFLALRILEVSQNLTALLKFHIHMTEQHKFQKLFNNMSIKANQRGHLDPIFQLVQKKNEKIPVNEWLITRSQMHLSV